MAYLPQPPEDQARVVRVNDVMEACEPHHKRWRRGANHVFGLYNNVNDWRSSLRDANTPRGRDSIWSDGQSTWGSDLFIPVAFAIVEQVVPLVVAGRPRMLAVPQEPRAEGNVENIQYVVDRQQQQMQYDLVLEEIAKAGIIYGLSFQKVFWDTCYRRRTSLQPSAAPAYANPSGFQEVTTLEQTFDDPRAICLDPFDVFWDPTAKDMHTCRYIVQRSWLTTEQIAEKAELGQWRNLDDIMFIDGLGDSMKYDEAWSERMTALGYSNLEKRGQNRQHEALEFNNGSEVITILDREICVEAKDNPHWHGELPTQCYRPTLVPGRIEGKGVIEPIEGLQAEINELRSARRDNARLIINQCFAFHDGMLDTDDFKFGPGLGIPVSGDPREILMPIRVGDIPYAGYQEEAALQADIRLTAGLADDRTEGGVMETATGAQLVHAATSRRAEAMTRRLELEIVAAGTSQMAQLSQQMILSRTARIDQLPTPGQPDRRWSWRQLDPTTLAGEFVWAPEGGVGAVNIPQDRADAKDLWTIGHNDPNVDQQALYREVFKKLGYKHPEALLAPPKAEAPAAALDILVQRLTSVYGMDPKQARAEVAMALDAALQEQGVGGGPPAPTPSANGQAVPA